MMKSIKLTLLVALTGLSALSHAQLMNEAEPLPGITTSGQPKEADLEALADKGYVAVIDLRTESEDRGFDEAAKVEALGMDYLSLPITSDTVNFENAAALDALLSEIDGPVLIHCASSNRVGAMLSLRESLAGKDDEAAFELGLAAGMSSPVLKETVQSLLSER